MNIDINIHKKARQKWIHFRDKFFEKEPNIIQERIFPKTDNSLHFHNFDQKSIPIHYDVRVETPSTLSLYVLLVSMIPITSLIIDGTEATYLNDLITPIDILLYIISFGLILGLAWFVADYHRTIMWDFQTQKIYLDDVIRRWIFHRKMFALGEILFVDYYPLPRKKNLVKNIYLYTVSESPICLVSYSNKTPKLKEIINSINELFMKWGVPPINEFWKICIKEYRDFVS